jgi:hypothetical protein
MRSSPLIVYCIVFLYYVEQTSLLSPYQCNFSGLLTDENTHCQVLINYLEIGLRAGE